MDINGWVDQYISEAFESRDEPRFSMAYQVVTALQAIDDDPVNALRMLGQARERALELREPWWIAFCDHWACQLYLFRIRRTDYALKIVVNALAEVQHDDYAGFPQRVCLHEDLIAAYQDIDPFGYAEEIDAAREFMRANIAGDCQCGYCLKLVDMDRDIHYGRYDEARRIGFDVLKSPYTESVGHYISQTYTMLCRIAHAREDYAELAHWAEAGSLFYGNMGYDKSNIEILMWHAFCTRRSGDEVEARRIYKRARKAARRQNYLHRAGYFDALSGYHLVGDRPDLALVARNIELRYAAGASYLECECRLKRLALLKKLGRAVDDELAELRQAAAGLKDPGRMLVAAESVLA